MILILGDSFNIFKEYQISEKAIYAVHSNPERFESLDNKVRLYLKSFCNEDSRKTLLLLGTQLNNDREIFAFSYWIPQEYNSSENSLLEVLEAFSYQFGLKIQIGEKEGYLIRFAEKLIPDKDPVLTDLIKILAPDQIPCEYFMFTSENMTETSKRVSIYYAFAINKGKYIFWLNSYPKIKLKIKSGWYEFVKNNLVDYVQPNGQTKIKIHKQKSTEELELDSNKNMTTLEVPTIYKEQFKYITSQINGLKNNEKIIFNISFESPKCIFCQSDNISKEHIFPIWLRPYIKETIFEGTQFSNFGNESLEKIMGTATSIGKKESSHGYTTKLVCVTCNNTWMSQLENEVKAILIKKDILKDSISSNISKDESEILSIWLIVKALLLSNKNFSNIHLIQKSIFENLKSRKIDTGFLVEAATADNPGFDFFVGKGLVHDNWIRLRNITLERAKELTANFFTCSIQLHRLLFRISYLESNIPFNRETTLKQTLKLFPFEANINHRKEENDDRIWKDTVDSGLELYLFGMGLILVEKDKND